MIIQPHPVPFLKLTEVPFGIYVYISCQIQLAYYDGLHYSLKNSMQTSMVTVHFLEMNLLSFV